MTLTKENIVAEEDYWAKFVDGDKSAFTHIYNFNIDALFSYGMKLHPDRDFVKDCIQDVFLDVFEHRNKLSTPRSVKHYLFVVLKRTMFKKLKKESKKESLSEFEKLSFITDYNIESITIDKEDQIYKKKLVNQIVKELTPKQQEILYLRFTKDFDYKEISEIIDIDHNSVRKQVYRAIKKLRKHDVFKDVIKILILYALSNN
ncbi:sigma-70 family RNA polymerase sigma factor [Sabulilitoribacter arenilitoris]|uniref:Sigma-70 family RNA polymerase sigma factor n=1 Tax=Wocania arenilitoris TaxID=2044858 RepID=A0AAE3JP16_9FLAO|nr:sigma-70 family RNA polymerase sigma factor [Wocania arenilitoris]MCF7569256.1 sigma-70 family RNA polymerase sigma factor [Wocania arenilitoris]